MKTLLLLGLVTISVATASFAVTAALLGASVVPASAGAIPSQSASPAPAVPTAAHTDPLPPSAAAWRPEAEGLLRPLTPTDVPAYLERTAILHLGIREGLLDPRLTITYHPDSAILTTEIRLRPDPRQREYAQVLAHSLVSLVQALDLPIRAIQISIAASTGRPELTAHIGLDAARARPPASWEPSAAGTRAFLAWAAVARPSPLPEERVSLSGAWAE
jgi:hypothetical protein